MAPVLSANPSFSRGGIRKNLLTSSSSSSSSLAPFALPDNNRRSGTLVERPSIDAILSSSSSAVGRNRSKTRPESKRFGQSGFVFSPRATRCALIGLFALLVFFPFECASELTSAEVEVTPPRGGGGVGGDGAENLHSEGDSDPKKVIGGFVDEGGNAASHIVKFDCSKAHHKRQEVHPPHCHNGGVMVEIHGGFHAAMPFQTCHCLCPREWTGPMCAMPTP